MSDAQIIHKKVRGVKYRTSKGGKLRPIKPQKRRVQLPRYYPWEILPGNRYDPDLPPFSWSVADYYKGQNARRSFYFVPEEERENHINGVRSGTLTISRIPAHWWTSDEILQCGGYTRDNGRNWKNIKVIFEKYIKARRISVKPTELDHIQRNAAFHLYGGIYETVSII